MTYQPSRWRLRFLSICSTLAVCVLLYRIVHVQIIQHETFLIKAKRQWHEKVIWPARRGSIFDRNGSPLAVTHRTYSLGVTPSHFPKDVEAVKYLSELLGLSTRELRKTLAKECAYVPLGRDLHLTKDKVAKVSSFSGVRLDQNQDRLYPFNAIVPQLVGNINRAAQGVSGIELAFQEILKGEDGWLLVNKDARDQAFQPLNAPGKEPRDGDDLYLTIDSRVQLIVDFELEQAVKRYKAVGGAAVVLNPFTGEIIAISEKHASGKSQDHFQSDEAALYTVSCIYEPGSTFKLITDSYLLESGSVDPYDVFYGEKGKGEFDFGVFRDEHPWEWLTFKESFIFSSNICTIKAMKESDPHDFYSYILRFGFGGRTGVNLPAESKGTLRKPSEWSSRSLPSISIGQEIGVTALQMAMAYSALANGGKLLVPRIALEAREGKGCIIKKFPVLMVRRVFSRETAKILKDFCKEVVLNGTGKKAAVTGISVAGKTGTSQKAGKSGYLPGRYVASFVGFAPVEEPKIVCLVVLDEPEYPYYWGGESSAVVFSKIVEGLNLTTDILCQETDRKIALGGDKGERIDVPSFLRLTPTEAIKLASDCGLQLQCSREQGVVYAQTPDPGTPVQRGEEVGLLFRPEAPSGENDIFVPDLRGLSIREARRMLIACGLKSRINGFGIVKKQRPAPGHLARRATAVTLYCHPKYRVSNPSKLALLNGDAN